MKQLARRARAARKKLAENKAKLIVTISRLGQTVGEMGFDDPREAFIEAFNARNAKYGLTAAVA